MAEDLRTLHVHQGFTYRATFDWLVNAATPTAIPLSGYLVTFVVLGRAGRLPALISVDSAIGDVEIHPGGVVGRTRVTLSAAQTALLRRSGAYALSASPISDPLIVEYVASGPLDLIKIGA